MSKVVRLETEEEPERFFDLEEEKIPDGIFDCRDSGPVKCPVVRVLPQRPFLMRQ
ncbi:MAG: hypothetical protein M0R30_13125 [Methanoregula sp.]|jgi:hypothetical protein|uniref:hypothetical protein n=1 Tax=Methanoregula sp. TaxID=2052170 RepID=UPI0025D29F2E|nr:hypothetical protein [Methanoregula sp.]MCK9632567.1 hypothetical protein [Methanoregula sp.]